MENKNQRINVLGVEISITNIEDSIKTILHWLDQGERHYVCVTPVHGIMECQKDEALRRIYNNSGLTVPDGMPLVWAGRLYGQSQMGRVFGPDLMLALCELSVDKGYSHFLYGGDTGVAEELRRRLKEQFPRIQIVGTFTPPFRSLNQAEEEKLVAQVAQVKPDIFWVGLGCPKQERFMGAYFPKLDTKVMLGVGAAFDFHANRANDAPLWMKITGLQWLHRLFQEPRRLWKRYLINNPIFVYKFMLQFMTRNHNLPKGNRTIGKL